MFKSYPRERFLYHFTKAKTAIDYILPSQQLRFSPYNKTNDPYETKNRSITINNSLDEIDKVTGDDKRTTIELMMNFNESRFKYIDSIKSKVKTLCFSEDIKNFNQDYKVSYFGFKRGWGYPRMWAQYGENHKGICLMIDRNLLYESINKEATKNFIIFNRAVNYTDELFDKELNCINIEEVKLSGIAESIMNRLNSNIEYFFFKKALDWQSEREFRYILTPKNDLEMEFIYVSIAKSLKVIIVGSEIEEDLENEVEKMANELRVSLYKIDWDCFIPMINNGQYQKWCNNIPNPFL